MGLFQSTIQMLAIMTAVQIQTSTGHRAREGVASVHVAQMSVDTIPTAVTPDG